MKKKTLILGLSILMSCFIQSALAAKAVTPPTSLTYSLEIQGANPNDTYFGTMSQAGLSTGTMYFFAPAMDNISTTGYRLTISSIAGSRNQLLPQQIEMATQEFDSFSIFHAPNYSSLTVVDCPNMSANELNVAQPLSIPPAQMTAILNTLFSGLSIPDADIKNASEFLIQKKAFKVIACHGGHGGILDLTNNDKTAQNFKTQFGQQWERVVEQLIENNPQDLTKGRK